MLNFIRFSLSANRKFLVGKDCVSQGIATPRNRRGEGVKGKILLCFVVGLSDNKAGSTSNKTQSQTLNIIND